MEPAIEAGVSPANPGSLQPRRLSGLAWRASVIRQNFRNGRCKVIYAGTRNDDAVAPAVSFLGDAQEFPTIILAEFHVKMLTLNLQFFGLDNVIHYSWSRRLYGSRFTEGKKNPRFFCTILPTEALPVLCPFAGGAEASRSIPNNLS